jgi:hypothetical protein
MRFEENKIILCSGKKGGCGCPTIHIDDKSYIRIDDDYGNTIKITPEEFLMFEDAVKQFKDKNV